MLKSKCLSLLALSILILGCNDEDTNNTTYQLLPLVSPSVNKARASGLLVDALELTSEADASLTSTTTEAAEALRDFFSDQVMSISGLVKNGWIDAYLNDLDTRIAEISVDTDPECLSSGAIDVPFETGFSGHQLTLKLQCIRSFEGPSDQSGVGSGMAYGRDDTNVYLYMMLSQKSQSNDKFGYAAIVNKNTDAVQLLFLQGNVTYNRTQFFHLRTQAEPKQFEFATAGTSDGAGPTATSTTHVLSAGSRFIANANFLRVEGVAATQTNAAGEPQDSFAFDEQECFDATDLSSEPATCAASAPDFASNMPLVMATELPSQTEVINSSLYTMQSLKNLGVAIDLGPPNTTE